MIIKRAMPENQAGGFGAPGTIRIMKTLTKEK